MCLSSTSTSTKEITPPKTISTASPKSKSSPGSTARSPTRPDHLSPGQVQFPSKVWGLLEKDTNNTHMTNNINIFSPLKSLFACSGLFPCEDPRVFWKDLNITGMTDKTTILFVTITKRSPGRGWFLAKIRGSLERDLDHLFQIGQGGRGHLVVKTKVIIISIPSMIIIVILEI